jgi:anti-sigma factor RsiW
MKNCERVRPLLTRVAYGEADPDEAIAAARHLSDCTTCRIHLARERRLATLLDEDLEDRLQVGEDFVQAVMANLPQGPPPAVGRRRRRRTLRLPLAGLALLLPLVPVAYAPRTRATDLRAWLPDLDLDSKLDLLGQFVGGTPPAGTLGALTAHLLSGGAPWPSAHGLEIAAVGLPVLVAVASASILLALATHSLLRPR